MNSLLVQMQRRRMKNRYPMQAFFANLHGAKIKSLEEILGAFEETPFDSETDKILEKRALEKLKEMQAHGRQ